MLRRDFILRNGQATSKTPNPERRVRLALPPALDLSGPALGLPGPPGPLTWRAFCAILLSNLDF